MTERTRDRAGCLLLAVFLLSVVPGGRTIVAQEAPDVPQGGLAIGAGSGSFVVTGEAYPEKRITVFYHRPAGFDRSSPVVMVIPGAGRNGDDYRDAWVPASEEHGVLVLSPGYPEEHYPEYWSYNLAGLTTEVTLDLAFVIDTDPETWALDEVTEEMASRVDPHELTGHSDAGPLLYQLLLLDRAGMLADLEIRGTEAQAGSDREKWIFDDFDRIFGAVKEALDLEAETYDLFGHSAGGQILHRLALFRPEGRTGRILAANSGWYTVPGFDEEFPYGLKGTGLTEAGLRKALRTAKLVVFLGEEDDADETRGSLRRTPAADRQGRTDWPGVGTSSERPGRRPRRSGWSCGGSWRSSRASGTTTGA